MEKYFYSLTDDKILYSTKTVDGVIDLGDAEITVECVLDDENLLQKLEDLHKKVDGKVSIKKVIVKHNEDYIADESKISKLVEIDEHLKKSNTKMEVWLNDAYGEVKNLVIARNQVEDFANKVNSFTYQKDGKEVPLSPLQKYFICYNFVANRYYNMDENFYNDSMRNWIGVLTADKVICSGFSSLLKCVCDKVFSPDELMCFRQGCKVLDKNNKNLGSHANNLIIVNDDVLGVRGLFTSDACWGSKKESNNNRVSYEYCINPISVYGKHQYYKFEFPSQLYFYRMVDGVSIKEKENVYGNDALLGIEKFVDSPTILSEDYLDRNCKLENEYKKFRDSENEKVIENNKAKFKDFIKKNNLENVMNIKIYKYFPQIIIDKIDCMEKFENLVNCKTFNEIEQNVELFKEFEQFYEEHKEAFLKFEKTHEDFDWFEVDYNERSLFKTIEDRLTSSCIEVEGVVDVCYYSEQFDKFVEDKLKKGIEQAVSGNETFFVPPGLDDETFKACYECIARFAGLTDEKDIEAYAQLELERTKQLKENQFELTGVSLSVCEK